MNFNMTIPGVKDVIVEKVEDSSGNSSAKIGRESSLFLG